MTAKMQALEKTLREALGSGEGVEYLLQLLKTLEATTPPQQAPES